MSEKLEKTRKQTKGVPLPYIRNEADEHFKQRVIANLAGISDDWDRGLMRKGTVDRVGVSTGTRAAKCTDCGSYFPPNSRYIHFEDAFFCPKCGGNIEFWAR